METFLFEKDGRRRAALEVECGNCKVLFLKRKDWIEDENFCSRLCSAARLKTKVEVECDFCTNTFWKIPSSASKSKSGLLFCSRLCKDSAQKIDSGLTGIQPSHYNTGDGKHRYRKVALAVFPSVCMNTLCNYDEHPELIEVHHIDADRSNNDISNLAVLCPTCHRAITLKLATMGPDRIWAWVGP